MFSSIKGEVTTKDVDKVVNKYLKGKKPNKIMASLEKKYVIPKGTFKTAYAGLLKGLLQVYINSYFAQNALLSQDSLLKNKDMMNNIDLNNLDKNTIDSMAKQAQTGTENNNFGHYYNNSYFPRSNRPIRFL